MTLGLVFDNSYARDLEGMYMEWVGDTLAAPRLVQLNSALARELGLDPEALNSAAGAAILSGSTMPEGAQPLAQAYAGHQFGGFSPQLGDGRAILLGELLDPKGQRVDLHLKGSGRTPFSRGGDGKAALGPVLREYLMGEAMHALGVPTTRALAATLTGETIQRDAPKQGAVLARVASSHLRVGTFQFFAARRDHDSLRKLLDYAIARHDPALIGAPDVALAFLRAVVTRQARLIAHWMALGFVHGVMNTDNMTLSGETIDYGPCAFMESYSASTVFSSIDRGGRYAYGNQPGVAQWNLARLAETLLPLIDTDGDQAAAQASEVLAEFAQVYTEAWQAHMRAKLGLHTARADDGALIDGLFAALEGQGADFTVFFRKLSALPEGGRSARAAVEALCADGMGVSSWIDIWLARLTAEGRPAPEVTQRMEGANPLYIPRNHLVEAALSAAEQGDFTPFEDLLAVLKTPFTRQEGRAAYAQPAPAEFGPYVTYCGT